MARNLSTEEIPAQIVEVQNRTWRVEVFCDINTDYLIKFHREQLKLLDGQLVGNAKQLGSIETRISERINKEVTVGGLTLTLGQIALFVAAFADALEEELQSPPAIPSPEEEAQTETENP